MSVRRGLPAGAVAVWIALGEFAPLDTALSPDGSAVAIIEERGNTSEVRFEQLSGWAPFGSYGTAPLAEVAY